MIQIENTWPAAEPFPPGRTRNWPARPDRRAQMPDPQGAASDEEAPLFPTAPPPMPWPRIFPGL